MPEPITEPPVSVTATPPHEATGRSPYADPVLDDRMAAILRTKTPTERLEIAFGMWTFAQQMVREAVRRDHPDWDEAQIARQVVQRMSHGAV